MWKTAAALGALLAMAAAAGCGGGQGGAGAAEGWIELEPGLAYVDTVPGGAETVQPQDFVEVHYTGWLWQDGRRGAKFDSSHDRGATAAFPIGRSAVIEGWEKGVPGMGVGGVRKLLIGPELAWGERGAPPDIPGGATVMFEVELLSLPEVAVEVVEPGDGPVVGLGDQIAVEYTGWLWADGAKGKQFDSSHDRGRPYRFTVGQGTAIAGWEMGFTGMAVGTRANLTVPPIMGYGAEGRPPLIPPDATLYFEVELVEIQGK